MSLITQPGADGVVVKYGNEVFVFPWTELHDVRELKLKSLDKAGISKELYASFHLFLDNRKTPLKDDERICDVRKGLTGSLLLVNYSETLIPIANGNKVIRRYRNNRSENTALLVLGDTGGDGQHLARHDDERDYEGNLAKGNSAQVNGNMSENTFGQLLETRRPRR